MDTPEHREAPIRVHFGAGLHAAAGRPVDAAAYEQYLGRWSRLFVPAVLAAAEVASGDRVLDVATGPGEAALLALSKVAPAGRVLGADISPAMLTAARARLGTGAFQPVAMDGQALAFRDGSFDAVVCQLGLQFFPEPARGLAEFQRVLRPGRCAAVCVIATPDRAPMWGVLAEALSRQLPEQGDVLHLTFALADTERLTHLFRRPDFTTSESRTRRAKGLLRRSTTTGPRLRPGQGSYRRRISRCLPHVVRQYGKRCRHDWRHSRPAGAW